MSTTDLAHQTKDGHQIKCPENSGGSSSGGWGIEGLGRGVGG